MGHLAAFIGSWFAEGFAVVGLNEIHGDISDKLKVRLQATYKNYHVKVLSHETNALVW